MAGASMGGLEELDPQSRREGVAFMVMTLPGEIEAAGKPRFYDRILQFAGVKDPGLARRQRLIGRILGSEELDVEEIMEKEAK